MTWTKFSDALPPKGKAFWRRWSPTSEPSSYYKYQHEALDTWQGHWSTDNIGEPPPYDDVEMPVIGGVQVTHKESLLSKSTMHRCYWECRDYQGLPSIIFQGDSKPTKREALQSLLDKIQVFQQIELPEIE